MSGGIKYRPSPSERELIRDSTGLFQSVFQRLEKKGVRLQWSDPELNVTAEETPQGTRFFISYPLDNDLRTNSGRLYLEDEFILARDDQRVISFERSFRQDVERDSKIPFWLDLARADHPQKNFNSRKSDIEQFLKDLKALPLPKSSDPAFREFQDKVLKNLHRPFPPDFKEYIRQNSEVFQELTDVLWPLGVQLKLADHQSGVAVRREGKKIHLKMTIVVDDNTGPDAISKEYSRIYLHDEFVIDSDTHRILEFHRKVTTTIDLGPTLTQAHELMMKAPDPEVTNTGLQNMVEALLKGLSLERKPAASPIELIVPVSVTDSPMRARAESRQAALRQPSQMNSDLTILKAAAFERLDKLRRADRAWLISSSGEESTRDPVRRTRALETLFESLAVHLGKNGGSLEDALESVARGNPLNLFLAHEVFASPPLKKLVTLLAEPDSAYREAALVTLTRNEFYGRDPWPATAAAIAQSLSEGNAGKGEIEGWLNGQTKFAQKIEALLPHIAGEVASPRMLASMALAGSVASFSKFAFLGRFGYQTRALRLGAEAAALALEAPVFLTTERLLASAFVSPENQWDHFGSELLGSYLAFGTLRFAGHGSARLNTHLQKTYFDSTLTAEAFVGKRFGSLLFRAGNFQPWVPELIQGALPHVAGFSSLVLANQLSRAMDLRPDSKQGWKSDFVDDLMMYGQFTLAGNFAGRIRPHLGLNGWEPYLREMEASSLQASDASSGRFKTFIENLKGWREWRLIKDPWSLVPQRFRFGKPVGTKPSGYQGVTKPMLALPPGQVSTEILGDNPASATPSAPGEIVPTHSSPPPITMPEPEAFLRFKRIPLSPNGGPRKEWILGRDEPLATMGTPVNNIPFAFADPGLKPRHARILATVATIDEVSIEGDAAPKTKIVGREYSIEALDGDVFLNELGIEPGATIPLKDQDVIHLGEGGKKLTFKIEGNIGFLQEAPIPLDPTKSEWTIGRLASKGPAADVTVPSSERQVSRLHTRILRNAKGQYFIENISSEGTFLGGDRIYGVKPLLHQDKVQIGGLHEKGDTPIFWFETPKVTRGKPPKDLPHFPKSVPPPPQAQVHPEYRGLGWQEVLVHVEGIRKQLEQGQSFEKALTDMGLSDQQLADAGLASSRPGPPSIQLARLAFSNKLTLELESDMTGFIIGSRPSHPDDPPYTAPLEIQGALEARHARIYIDDQGRFILEDLNSAKGVFVHPRTYRDVEKIIENPKTNDVKTENERKWHEIPDKLPHLARVSGWTFLYGGERVYLGKKLYFDFWPGTVYEAHRGGTSRAGEIQIPETKQNPKTK